ncbi:universal stress protein [Yeosuana aromativorans]|uniref:Universal stress protein n=1 Tax=Yeosuana aromativorans TaxID=288019 RepID=A0A8J3BV46_9FLAO|nr:universal stress protein [Yeosuana aromativorans]GGK32394.1 universal stress protein [Yeosuana aromativorans]
MSYSKILIAVDSSEYSMQAAKKGFEMAHQLHAEVALLYVVDTSKALGNIDAGISAEQSLLVLKKEAEQTLDELAAMYDGDAVMKFMPEGLPTKDILKTATVWEADLIIMGTHGRTGLLHLLVGSVAEHVIRHSKIPVMVVPSK